MAATRQRNQVIAGKDASPRLTHPVAQEDTTPLQLALDIFSALEPYDKGIADSTQEIGFRKNNLFLEITGLGLTARRAIDVAYFIVSQPNDENDLYESHAYRYSVDQNFFKWLMGTSSRNWRHLRGVLREAQAAAIEITSGPDPVDANCAVEAKTTEAGTKAPVRPKMNDNAKWGSVQLIGTVSIHSGRVNFEVNPALAKHIKNPQSYHFLSLRYVFRSLYAKTLYDLLIPYVSVGMTPWLELGELRTSLGSTKKLYDQYKFLRHYVLAPAIAEINELTDLRADIETRSVPGSKKIGYVRFTMQRDDAVAARDPNQELKEIYLTLRNEFGIVGRQFDEILTHREEWTHERIYDAIEYTRYMLRKGQVKFSPGGYLMKALREGYKLGSAQLELEAVSQQQAQKDAARLQPPDPYAKESLPMKGLEERQAQSRAGLERFEAVDPTTQEELAQRFLTSPQAKIAALKDRILKSQWREHLAQPGFFRDEFGCFIAREQAVKD